MTTVSLQESITVSRSAEHCMRYLRDFSTIEQWDPGVLRAEKLTPGPARVGSRFRLLLSLPGRQTPMEYLLEEIAPRRLVLQGSGPGFSARDTLELVERGNETTIRYRAELTLEQVGPLPARALKPWLSRLGRKAVTGLAAALEDPVPPTTPDPADRLRDRLILPGMRQFTRRGYRAMPDKGLSQFMDGQTVVITGPTAGLGLATACELARLGAHLVLVGRNPDRLEAARGQIINFAGCAPDRLRTFAADLALMAQVREVAGRIIRESPRIDVLINNAGALFAERGETAEGVERCLAINLYAPALLTHLLRERLAGGRVINVASGGMYLQGLRSDDMAYVKSPYDGAKAYARAKRALVCLTRHQARSGDGIAYHAMHPGWAATPGVEKSLPAFNRRMHRQLRDPRMGADTIAWLASTRSLSADHNGLFWLDRRPHVTEVLPGTRVSARQQRALLEHLHEHLGIRA